MNSKQLDKSSTSVARLAQRQSITFTRSLEKSVLLRKISVADDREPIRPDLCPDPGRLKRPQARRFVRIERGLYRYAPSGAIYLCRKHHGRNIWRNLKTSDKGQAVVIAGLYGVDQMQNGNCEITVLPVGGGTGPIQFIPPPVEEKPPSPSTPQLVPAPAPPPVPEIKEGMTLQSLADKAKAQWKHLAPKTQDLRKCYLSILEKFIPFSTDVTQIKPGLIREIRGAMTQGRKASTVNDVLSKGLRPLLALAVELGFIDKSPLDAIKPLKKSNPIRLQPSWQEAQQIIEHVEKSSPDSAAPLRFMLLFGIGQAEVQGLRGEHFDFDREELHLYRQKTQKEYTVPIYPHAKAFVQELKEKGMIVNGKPVFDWHNPRKALESACLALGLPKYSPRSLRRCFVVYCLEKGMDARVVADYQGHADATLILRVYGKFISQEHKKLQVAKLE